MVVRGVLEGVRSSIRAAPCALGPSFCFRASSPQNGGVHVERNLLLCAIADCSQQHEDHGNFRYKCEDLFWGHVRGAHEDLAHRVENLTIFTGIRAIRYSDDARICDNRGVGIG